MRRALEQYASCSPDAIASGSKAQMMYFVEDAKADIALLAEQLDDARLERDEAITNGQDRIADLGAELDQAAGFIEIHKDENARLLASNAGLKEALQDARTWLEGWASAEPYLAKINAALSKGECEIQIEIDGSAICRRCNYRTFDSPAACTAALAGHEQAETGETTGVLLTRLGVMKTAQEAAEIVEGWSKAKQDYADRIVRCGSIPASPGKGAE